MTFLSSERVLAAGIVSKEPPETAISLFARLVPLKVPPEMFVLRSILPPSKEPPEIAESSRLRIIPSGPISIMPLWVSYSKVVFLKFPPVIVAAL